MVGAASRLTQGRAFGCAGCALLEAAQALRTGPAGPALDSATALASWVPALRPRNGPTTHAPPAPAFLKCLERPSPARRICNGSLRVQPAPNAAVLRRSWPGRSFLSASSPLPASAAPVGVGLAELPF